MGCCGDDNTKMKQAGKIIKGYTLSVADKIGLTTPYKFKDDRIRQCHRCDKSTWMTRMEHLDWLIEHKVEVFDNFACLESLPELPRYERDDRRKNIYCCICKCLIPVAADIPEKKCLHPEGDKWKPLEEITNGSTVEPPAD